MKRSLIPAFAALLVLSACTTDAATPSVTSEAPQPTEAAPPALADLYRPYRYAGPPASSGAHTFPTRVPPPSLDAANAEAAVYLDGVERSEDQRAEEFSGVPGTTDYTCVDIEEAGDRGLVRSGDFVLDVAAWRPPEQHFSLTPRRGWDRLFLRATRIDDDRERNPATLTHEYDHPSWEGDAPSTDEQRFAPTFVLPEAGRWLVVATAGPQWGCFVVTADDPPDALTFPATVEEAHAMAETYPSEPGPAYISRAFLEPRGPGISANEGRWEMRGVETRECVDIADGHDVRSGEWIIRPAQGLFGSEPTWEHSKFLAIPLHQPDTQAELQEWTGTARTYLRIAGAYLDAPQHTYVYEFKRPSGARGNPDGQIEFEYLVRAVLPLRGDWLITLTDGASGTQWGCFMS
ncbi:MAG: hypothetical protein M0R75_13270 [Dehalococcoidia bacterium]|nr:hypothetical protein [Dehalococcoidia bacterium]